MLRPRVTLLRACAALAAAGLTSGCATKAQIDFDPNAPFDQYRTFAWQAAEGETSEALAGQADPLLVRRIREAIEENLTSKGYRKVEDPAGADFVVGFSLSSREKLQSQSQISIGFGSFGSHGGGGVGVSTPVSGQSATEGTLSIDMFDGRSHQAVWHGSASKQVTPSMDRAVLVNDVVGAILAKFPPER